MANRVPSAPTEPADSARIIVPRRLRLLVVSGPDRGQHMDLESGSYHVGQDPECALVLRDRKVSRRHLELEVRAEGVQVRDLGSRNGSFHEGARFTQITIGSGAVLKVGTTELKLVSADRSPPMLPSTEEAFGALVGRSLAMRQVFAVLQRVAPADAPVLVNGETGTGKEVCAEAIHARSSRAAGPFIVCDCAALAPSLVESELFGHVRGAFTGADASREGAFAQADGGTLFIDEIGELDLEAQPRLLRALDTHKVKPIGSTTYRSVDVRVIAATNRDLREEVKQHRFREDLFHRLSVLEVTLPPLRERKEDLPLLIRTLSGEPGLTIAPEAEALLLQHDWPGNVRELRNVVQRARSRSSGPVLEPEALGLGDGGEVPATFHAAKDRLIANWERAYVEGLLQRTRGNVSRAARVAGLDRVSLHRLIKKHAISVDESE
ncbi:MAG TPA: sigma 54-interacting transcriptional regulator [Kofleriaceae bacterium]|nr:sigma 54-interacting transcriptional regulator [Kofleriaceae bacterium]